MDDDIVFPHSSSQRAFGASNQGHYSLRQEQQSPSSFFGQFLMYLLDIFTGPNFGVLMAVVVIILLHFKGTLLDFFCNALEDGLRQTLMEVFFGFQDLTRAYYQMTCERFRGLRFFASRGNSQQPARTRSQLGSSPPPLVTVLEDSQGTIMPYDGHATAHASYRAAKKTKTTCSRGLAVDPPTEMDTVGAGVVLAPEINMKPCANSEEREHDQRTLAEPTPPSTSSTPFSHAQRDRIEPAFLNENDYPPGWLVYHPVLGVVPKEEADQYDKDISPSPPNHAILSHSIEAGG